MASFRIFLALEELAAAVQSARKDLKVLSMIASDVWIVAIRLCQQPASQRCQRLYLPWRSRSVMTTINYAV
jgi:hypothetical protein